MPDHPTPDGPTPDGPTPGDLVPGDLVPGDPTPGDLVPDDAGKPPEPEAGYIPRQPSDEDVRRISEQQALITDEWAPEPPPAER